MASQPSYTFFENAYVREPSGRGHGSFGLHYVPWSLHLGMIQKMENGRVFYTEGVCKVKKMHEKAQRSHVKSAFKRFFCLFFEDFVRLENSNPKCWVVCVNVSIGESRQHGESGRLTGIP